MYPRQASGQPNDNKIEGGNKQSTIKSRLYCIEVFWSTLAGSNTVLDNCGGLEAKYGMSKKRIAVLVESLRLEHFSGAEIESPHEPIQSFLDAFNERMKQVIKPGRIIIVDECTSMWKAIERTYHRESCIKGTSRIIFTCGLSIIVARLSPKGPLHSSSIGIEVLQLPDEDINDSSPPSRPPSASPDRQVQPHLRPSCSQAMDPLAPVSAG